MKNRDQNKKRLCAAAGLLVAFALWTVAVRVLDVRAIGPCGSTVGFATLNQFTHALTGVHMMLYTVTDWLGLIPIGTAMGFAVLGLVQWIRRKKISRVDRSLFVLGGFYLVVIALFVLFEVMVINYRPVLIDGVLEASYPSSTTLLVMCVMPTTAMQLRTRIRNATIRCCLTLAIALFVAFMVIGRLLSGVHWVTDIIGGALLSAGLVTLYSFVSKEQRLADCKSLKEKQSLSHLW